MSSKQTPLPAMPTTTVENRIARVATTQAVEGLKMTLEDAELLRRHARGELSDAEYLRLALEEAQRHA